MSEVSLKRFFSAVALLLCAASAFAATPSARYETRMSYDPVGRRAILFGGLTNTDTGTKLAYYLGDTWQWNGARWVQLYPQHSPAGRSGETMVYDSNRNHIVIFGGRTTSTDANDTWYFNGSDWQQIQTPNSPPGRFLAGGAYDPVRDRFVIFGGIQTSTTPGTTTIVNTSIYDTWEFDGTTWKQIGGSGPTVAKPVLTYDEARNQVIMLGVDTSFNTLMYAYDPNAGVWNQLKPAKLPSCVNEGILIYNKADEKPFFSSGVCSGSTQTDNETAEWDGTNWTLSSPVSNAVRQFGSGATYDVGRSEVVEFGGTQSGLLPGNLTYLYTADNPGWIAENDTTMPGARSLFGFTTDPVNNAIWLFGGYVEGTNAEDLWQFQGGQWTQIAGLTNAPDSTCLTPVTSYDTDRHKLVVECSTGATFEWDGTAWAAPSLKTLPPSKQWGKMVYDQTLKKTVLFGGYDGTNYSDETWLYDGTNWTRIKNNPPPARELPAMWWDPNLKKTVIYGGVGRITTTDRITYYDDMWSFDGTGWTLLTPASGTPGRRYGPEAAVDPRTNTLVLFGGIHVATVPPTPPITVPLDVATYVNDTWSWDGTAWTKLTTDGTPPPHENGGFAFDPTLNTMVMYGGYAGQYFSDMWTFSGTTWRVRADSDGSRRRTAGH